MIRRADRHDGMRFWVRTRTRWLVLHRRDWVIWVSSALFLSTALLAMLMVVGPSRFRYYTDGLTIRRHAHESTPRYVLWETPDPVPLPSNWAASVEDPCLSADGRTLLFAARLPGERADLYLCRKEWGLWGKPLAIEAVNTAFIEQGPEVSPDGNFLFFQSDRPSGLGGLDIWAARWDGRDWVEPVNLGPRVNSPADDCDPAVAPDSDRLYFASNRGSDHPALVDPATTDGTGPPTFDLFVAAVREFHEPEPGARIRPLPEFWMAERIVRLRSPFDERHPNITPRGDLLYFASNRPDGFGEFDLYQCRLLNRALTEPENAGQPINTPADEMAPALGVEGFGLFYCSNYGQPNPAAFAIYHTMSREVVARSDLSLLRDLLGPFLIFAIAVAAFAYLLRLLLNSQLRREQSLTNKCFLGSILLHLLMILLFGLWMISSKVIEVLEDRPLEIMVNINALAQESIALAIREQVAALPKTDKARPIKQQVDRIPIPDVTPMEKTMAPPDEQWSADTFAIEVEQMMRVVDVRDTLEPAQTLVKLTPFPAEAPKVTMEVMQRPTEEGVRQDAPIAERAKRKPPEPQTKEVLARKKLRVDILRTATKPVTAHGRPRSLPPGPIVASATNAPVATIDDRFQALTGKFPASYSELNARVGPGRREFGNSAGTLHLPFSIRLETRTMEPKPPSRTLGPLLADRRVGQMRNFQARADTARRPDITIDQPSLKGPATDDVKPPATVRIDPDLTGLSRVGQLVRDRIDMLELPAGERLDVPEKFEPKLP